MLCVKYTKQIIADSETVLHKWCAHHWRWNKY